MRLFELQTEFFLPLWRRVVVVAVCLAWTVFEFVSGSPFWGMLFGGMGLYALWQLFLDGWPGNRKDT